QSLKWLKTFEFEVGRAGYLLASRGDGSRLPESSPDANTRAPSTVRICTLASTLGEGVRPGSVAGAGWHGLASVDDRRRLDRDADRLLGRPDHPRHRDP